MGTTSCAEGSFAGLEGSGKNWNALSARSPSPATLRSVCNGYVMRSDNCTDIQNQSPGGWFRYIDSVCTHSMYNWRHKVDVEDGIDINHMEHDRSSKEPDASNSCHGERKIAFALCKPTKVENTEYGYLPTQELVGTDWRESSVGAHRFPNIRKSALTPYCLPN